MRPSFTIGIEEEYQTVDPVTRDLRSHLSRRRCLPKASAAWQERVKAEMHQSVIEVGTCICKNMKEAHNDLFDLRRRQISLGRVSTIYCWWRGLRIPSPTGARRRFTPIPAMRSVVEDLQLVARANLIFGLHVHIGIEDREVAIRIMNSHALFSSPHFGPFYQFTLLAWHEDRLQELSREGLRQVPAHQYSRPF